LFCEDLIAVKLTLISGQFVTGKILNIFIPENPGINKIENKLSQLSHSIK
jgi:hypothetical protein